MKLLLLILPLYLGAAPLFAREAPVDSTQVKRPVFAMTPT
jgi:hypothetical protein